MHGSNGSSRGSKGPLEGLLTFVAMPTWNPAPLRGGNNGAVCACSLPRPGGSSSRDTGFQGMRSAPHLCTLPSTQGPADRAAEPLRG